MIISIAQSTRGGRTTLRSDSMGEKVSKWLFLENHAQTLLLHLPVTSKREFYNVTTVTSEPSKKFSVASHDMKFMFPSFLMIISISQSKRGGRTTLRSDSMGAKVSKWSFFKNHAQTPLSTSTGDFKRRVSQSGDGDFKALQKIFCSFP